MNKGLHFEAENENGAKLQFDALPSDGGLGEGLAPSPMQGLLASLAGCTVFDVVLILQKKRQNLLDVQVVADGQRRAEGQVKPFERIHLHYKLFGDIDHNAAEQTVQLSVEKYCSVAKSLSEKIEISHSFEIIKA